MLQLKRTVRRIERADIPSRSGDSVRMYTGWSMLESDILQIVSALHLLSDPFVETQGYAMFRRTHAFRRVVVKFS